MYFPRPYADELAGSLIVRARRHLGLSRGQMSELLYERPDRRLPFTFSTAIPRIAYLAGLDVEEFLLLHTPFRYVCAFSSASYVERAWTALTGVNVLERRHACALNRVAMMGDPFRRFCPMCAEAERTLLGETYWHLAHNLPGVDVCERHGCLLCRSPACLIKAERGLVALLPLDRPFSLIEQMADCEVLHSIADESARLSRCLDLTEHSAASYSRWAENLGFVRDDTGQPNIALLSRTCTRFFGEAFLRAHRLTLTDRSAPSWMSSLLTGSQKSLATIHHVLLQTFLHNTKHATEIDPDEIAERDRELAQRDERIARNCLSQIERLRVSGQRGNVKSVLLPAGGWTIYRARTKGYPLMHQMIDEFLKSDQSYGRRAPHRS